MSCFAKWGSIFWIQGNFFLPSKFGYKFHKIVTSQFLSMIKFNFKVKISKFRCQKRFSDLAENWLTWTSGEMTKSIFGDCDVTIFKHDKIRFYSKISKFRRQKRFSDLAQNWLRWSSGEMKKINIWGLWRHNFYAEKIRFYCRDFENFGSKTPTRRGRFFTFEKKKEIFWQNEKKRRSFYNSSRLKERESFYKYF